MSKINNLGVLIDISRGAVMKMDYYKQLVDMLSQMGYTFIELYSEDAFEVKEEPFLGYLRGKYTIDELKEMDEYAKNKGIELIPAIQTLAHFTSLCTNEKINEELFDIDDILLADSERTYTFIENIIKTCREAFSTNKINIGMDEAWHLGQGRYLSKSGLKNKREILLQHLGIIAKICDKYGFECQMWSDMFMEMIGQSNNNDEINNIKTLLPKNVTLCMWDYTTTDQVSYDSKLKLHKTITNKVAFAGGAWCWRGFAPLNWLALSTLEPSIKACLNNDIDTLLVTLWGDDGNETSKLTTLPTLFAASEFAKGNFVMNNIKEKFNSKFNIEFDLMMSLEIPNYLYQNNIRREDMFNACKILFYNDPFIGKADYLLNSYDRINYDEYYKILKKSTKFAGNFKNLFIEEAVLCKFLSHKAYLGFDLKNAYKNKDKKALKKSLKEFSKSIKYLGQFKKEFDELWLAQNKPYCLEIHDARIGGLLERLRTCRYRLKMYLNKGIKIVELENQEELNYWYDDKFWSNKYRDIISTNNF